MFDFLNIILVLIIVGMSFWIFKLYRNEKDTDSEIKTLIKEKEEYEEIGKGLVEYNQKLQEKKNQAKDRMMVLLKEKGKVSNREAAKLLNISSATVRRYFDELEAENKVKQVGKVGQNVFYSLI